jgi:hypothetical protein
VTRLLDRITRLEHVLQPLNANTGTLEWHHTNGGTLSPEQLPCDKRQEHGAGCVMSVTPTDTGVRFMRIITGTDSPSPDRHPRGSL